MHAAEAAVLGAIAGVTPIGILLFRLVGCATLQVDDFGPALRSLVLVLKALLKEAQLNERAVGGLGSYSEPPPLLSFSCLHFPSCPPQS